MLGSWVVGWRRGIVRDTMAEEVGPRGESNCWEFRVFWLNQGTPLHPNSIDAVRIRIHESQPDNPGL
jgi:hypothetical protein